MFAHYDFKCLNENRRSSTVVQIFEWDRCFGGIVPYLSADDGWKEHKMAGMEGYFGPRAYNPNSSFREIYNDLEYERHMFRGSQRPNSIDLHQTVPKQIPTNTVYEDDGEVFLNDLVWKFIVYFYLHG